MVVMRSGISWCTGTLNAWVGCTAVSAGCDHCYAKALVERLPRNFANKFETVSLHLDRLAQVQKMRPQMGTDGRRLPFLCFVNSMSDFWHEQVPGTAIDTALDVFEQHPDTVFQILTKRPVRMRKVLTERYGAGRGIPPHLWIGVSVESNDVAARINILRRLKDGVGEMTAFLSVEPIVGPTDELDFAGIDWIITGGESGTNARYMDRDWLIPAIEGAQKTGAALWHKQNGAMRGHPNLKDVPRDMQKQGITARFEWLVKNGFEILPEEKGGATVDRKTYRQMPPAYHALVARLNQAPAQAAML